MKIPLLAAFATTVLFATVPVSAPVQATTAILRCQSADGTLVYTDKACSSLGARAVPMPGELLTRIAHDEALRAGDASDAGAVAYGASGTTAIGPARRSASGGCARTPTQLAMDLRGSLMVGDVNRVAESYDWAGMSSRQGERTLDRLQHLIGRPVIDSHYFDAQIGTAPTLGVMPDAGGSLVASTGAHAGGTAGVLQLALASGSNPAAVGSVLNFDVKKYAGCYFVRF